MARRPHDLGMLTRGGPARTRLLVATALVFLWSFAMMSSGLRTAVDKDIHWYITGIGLILATLIVPKIRAKRISSCLVPAWLFIAAMLLAALWGGNDMLRHLAQAGKVFVALSLILPLFLLWDFSILYAFIWAAAFASVVNALLLLGRSYVPEFVGPTGEGRWTTLLAGPGSLARIGLFVLPWSLNHLLSTRQWGVRLPNVLIAACSVTVIVLDGSRAFLLIAGVCAVYTVVATLYDLGLTRKAVFALAAAIVLGGLLLSQRYQDNSFFGLPISARISRFFDEAQSRDLAQIDPTRYELLRLGWAAIADHPLIGSGLLSVTLQTGDTPGVHNAYVQSWADIGILGLLSYVGLSMGWLLGLRRAWRATQSSDGRTRALFHVSVCGLATFAMAGLYHGISVELTELFYFIAPAAIFWRFTAPFARSQVSRPVRNHPAVPCVRYTALR